MAKGVIADPMAEVFGIHGTKIHGTRWYTQAFYTKAVLVGELCFSEPRTCVRVAADIKSRRTPYQVTRAMSQRPRTKVRLQ
jgi:hypothetical protein